jgi:hypothetical protein
VPELIEYLKNIVDSDEFCSKHKQNPKDFTRKRSLPFSDLILFLLNMNNKSYQDELDRFFQAVNHWEVARRVIYKGNLPKARAKLKYQAFTDLNAHLTEFFYDHFQHDKWNGFNLLAIDGTTLRLPDEAAIKEHFGVWNSTKGEKPCAKGRVSQMFDVRNKITIDARIHPKGTGEREIAAFHFLKLQPDDLILLDRGYPAYWLFQLAKSMEANFCARISHKTWNATEKFYKSGLTEQVVKLHPTSVSLRKCHEMGLDKKPLKVRLIRVELESGETEILVTSLLNKDRYPHRLFADLYHWRWPVEEDYKLMKYRIEIENFSGKTVHSVYQDFHAKVLSKNIVAAVAHTTIPRILQKSIALKFQHQLNRAQAVSRMKNTIVLFFKRSHDVMIELVEQIRTIFVQTTEAVRPGRKYPRRNRVKQARFFHELKTVA